MILPCWCSVGAASLPHTSVAQVGDTVDWPRKYIFFGSFFNQALVKYAIVLVNITKRTPAYGTFLYILGQECFWQRFKGVNRRAWGQLIIINIPMCPSMLESAIRWRHDGTMTGSSSRSVLPIRSLQDVIRHDTFDIFGSADLTIFRGRTLFTAYQWTLMAAAECFSTSFGTWKNTAGDGAGHLTVRARP